MAKATDTPVKAGADGAGTPVNPVDVKIAPYKTTAKSKAFKPHKDEKPKTQKTPVVNSVAQLRDESIRQNRPVSQQQLDEMKKVEGEQLAEDSKKARVQD